MHQNIPYHPNPFGSVMQSRNWTDANRNYRYGFNNEEKDQIGLGGGGATYDYGFRIYNSNIGRFLSVDPIGKQFSWFSSYQFAGNTVIQAVDIDGLEIYYSQSGEKLGQYGTSTEIRVVNEDQLETTKKEFVSYKAALKSDANATNVFLSTTLLNSGSIAYKDYFTTVYDVTKDAELIVYSQPWTYGNKKPNCRDAAEKQLNNNGQFTGPPSYSIQASVDDKIQKDAYNAQNSNPRTASGNCPAYLSDDPIGASIYVQTQLKKGHAVLVGISYKNSAGQTIGIPIGPNNFYNRNAITGHFVVINSCTVDANGNVSFGYLDNASKQGGKSVNNQLNLDKSSGKMTDTTDVCTGNVDGYEVSEVRINR